MKQNDVKRTLGYDLQIFADEPTPQGGNDPTPEPTPQPSNDPTPEPAPTPTVESLTAEVAKLTAMIAKQKNDYDKLCSSEATLRKQLREKQTAEEQLAEAQAEEKAQHEEYVKGLERQIAVSDAIKTYLAMGMSEELATETATADIDGNKDVVRANVAKHNAAWRKEQEAAIRAEYLGSMPQLASGNETGIDYSKQFNDAMDNGDAQAAALAILEQSKFTAPQMLAQP